MTGGEPSPPLSESAFGGLKRPGRLRSDSLLPQALNLHCQRPPQADSAEQSCHPVVAAPQPGPQRFGGGLTYHGPSHRTHLTDRRCPRLLIHATNHALLYSAPFPYVPSRIAPRRHAIGLPRLAPFSRSKLAPISRSLPICFLTSLPPSPKFAWRDPFFRFNNGTYPLFRVLAPTLKEAE